MGRCNLKASVPNSMSTVTIADYGTILSQGAPHTFAFKFKISFIAGFTHTAVSPDVSGLVVAIVINSSLSNNPVFNIVQL